MSKRQPPLPQNIPAIWLVSDARNDARLERILARLPRGSGLIYRHYHLPLKGRRARFDALRRIARHHGHRVFLAADARTAQAWRADGAYGSADLLASGPALPRLVTAHSLRELRRTRADAVLLSPVFPTRSHPGAASLGPTRFHLLTRLAQVPVIALGGMTPPRAAWLKPAGWAAIDGLSSSDMRRIPKDS